MLIAAYANTYLQANAASGEVFKPRMLCCLLDFCSWPKRHHLAGGQRF